MITYSFDYAFRINQVKQVQNLLFVEVIDSVFLGRKYLIFISFILPPHLSENGLLKRYFNGKKKLC